MFSTSCTTRSGRTDENRADSTGSVCRTVVSPNMYVGTSRPEASGWLRNVSCSTSCSSMPSSSPRTVGSGSESRNGSPAATVTSWPAAAHATASGSIGYRCP